MGIWGLQTFLETGCKDAVIKVDLQKLVAQHKLENDTDEAVILMSLQSLSSFLYGRLDWLFAKQLVELRQNVQRFVHGWQRIGANIVIFDGQVTTDRKRDIWAQRRLKDIERNNMIFDIVDRYNSSPDTEELEPDFNGIKTNVGAALFTKKMFIELNCKIISSCGEADEEIAQYARDNHCFGYISDDSDYVIYNAARYCFSLRSLDVEMMTVNRYDVAALAAHLNIPILLLPLWASLCGNDVIRRDDLKGFHLWIMPRNPRRRQWKMETIADYVRQSATAEMSDANLVEIAEVVFRDASRAKDLRESIASYLPMSPSPAQTVEFAETDWGSILRFCQSNEAYKHGIYAIMTGSPREIMSFFEDYRKSDLPVSSRLLQLLRQRLYGILLKQKPDGPGVVEEWWMSGERSLLQPNQVVTVLPQEVFGCYSRAVLRWSNGRTKTSRVDIQA